MYILLYLNSVIKCYDMNHRMGHLESLIMEKVKKTCPIILHIVFYLKTFLTIVDEQPGDDETNNLVLRRGKLPRPRICPPVAYTLMNKCLDQEGESLTFGDIQISLRSMDMYLVMGSVEESFAKELVTESLENVHYILNNFIE